MIALIFILPVALAALSLAFRQKVLNRILLAGYAIVFLAVAALMAAGADFFVLPDAFLKYFTVDPLAKVSILVLAVVFLGVCFYSFHYLKARNLNRLWDTLYTVFLLVFLMSMSGGILSSHLGLLWVFIEATTLTGAVLIYTEQEKSSLEAVWKYVFVCSIGVAFSFIGIIVLSLGSRELNSLFFTDLYQGAGRINPFLLKLSFAFILVGFGTKMGLAPVHAWLPDAHSEAPSPVSALLSGTLLNVAFIAILRYNGLMINAGQEFFAGVLVLSMGGLSLLVSAAFILFAKNYKRMLAYSSIENMGLMAIGLAMGGAGIFASLLHMIVHSLSKASLFLVSGNIYGLYHSKKIDEVSGLLKRDGKTGVLWILSFLALSGLPPFAGFVSKYFLARAMFERGYIWLFIPVFILILIILAGMARAVFSMTFALPRTGEGAKQGGLSFWAYAPSFGFLLILLLLGLFVPDFLKSMIDQAAAVFSPVTRSVP